MKTICLRNSKLKAFVDDEDYEYFSKFKWYPIKYKTSKTFYANRHIKFLGKTLNFKMHREVMLLKIGDNEIVDHINGNGLDNRKENLRLSNRSLNSVNRKLLRNTNKSGYCGVSRVKGLKKNKWTAHITKNNKNIYLGLFKSKKEAARAYNEKARKLYGENITLNKI